MSGTKYVLLLGDDERLLLSFDGDLGYLRETVLNFEQSPSIGVIYEAFTENVMEIVEKVRENSAKAGVYGTEQKARFFLYRSLAVSTDDKLELEEITL